MNRKLGRRYVVALALAIWIECLYCPLLQLCFVVYICYRGGFLDVELTLLNGYWLFCAVAERVNSSGGTVYNLSSFSSLPFPTLHVLPLKRRSGVLSRAILKFYIADGEFDRIFREKN
jgi:hypothetical protein